MPSKAYASVPTKVLIFIAWRNLVHKRLRAFLTVFGIVIGIGAIFFLLSFGIGLQRLVTNQVVGNQSIKSIDVTTPNSKVVKLDQKAFQQIKNLPHVARIGASFSYPGTLNARGSAVDTIVYGVDANYQALSSLSLKTGRLIDQHDDKTTVINLSTLSAIGIKTPEKAIGTSLSLKLPALQSAQPNLTSSFKIVGVTSDSGGNEVYIPSGIFSAGGIKNYTQIKIEADSASSVRALRSQIETLGLQTVSPIDTIDQINQVFKFFNIILAGFGAIGMIVAVLGMFNTLTISLLERTREIGLMLALGGRNSDMRKLFIFEAVLLSLVGAAIGIAGAIIVGQIVNLTMNILAHRRGVTEGFQLFAVPWWLVLGTLAFMICVGLIVVYIPARRAARINPIEALRRE